MYALKFTTSLLSFALIFLCANPAQGQIQQIHEELQRLTLSKDSISLVNSLNRLGTLYRTRNADSCFYYGMKAKRTATNIQYRKGQTDADHVIAFALYKRGLYAESLELLGKTLPYYQQLDDTEKVIQVYTDMAKVLNKGIDKTKAISLSQKAIQIGGKLKRDSVMSMVYANYCLRNSDLPPDSINYYLSKSEEISGRYNDERMLNYNGMLRAHFLILDGQLQEALPLVRQSLSDAQRTGNPTLQISSLFLMVGIEDNLKMALEYLYQAYAVAQKNGDSYLEIYILSSALAFANQLGDKDEIINVYVELEKSMSAEWERSKKFMGDYVRYNAIQNDNKLLSAENAQRTIWLLVVSFSSAIVVLAIYLVMLRRGRKAKVQVESLNNAANLQVIAMEEAKHQAVRDEQQRLGQDLHDGLSSSLAGINHQLEVLSMDTNDTSLKHRLGVLKSEVTKAYEAARNKSHEWFNAAVEQEELSFERRIRLLADSALPDSRYRKEVHIDNHSLLPVNADTRIALLRIIQEAITNIIKHAKATMVEVLVYEEMESLVTIVKDNGKGLTKKGGHDRKSSMGIQSIQRRAQLLNGELDIRSDGRGTEIIVTIPVKR